MIVGISGRVSFKDESEAEILVEDIVPIENIASLGRPRQRNGAENGGYYQGETGYPAGDMYPPEPNVRQAGRQPSALNDPVKLRISENGLAAHGSPRKVLMHLTDMMSLYRGDRDVLVYLPGQKPVRGSADNRITLTDELRGKLVRLLGEENVKG